MLPITRATVDDFCRSCLRELGKIEDTKEPNHDLQDEPCLLSCFQAITNTTQMPLSLPLPRYLCHSCYIKTNMFYKFGEAAICTGIALREMAIEHTSELTKNETLERFKKICLTCFRNMPHLQPSSGAMDLLSAPLLQICLQNITGMEMKKGDDNRLLPTHICKLCCPKLRTFEAFRRLGIESRQYIESFLWNVENEVEGSTAPDLAIVDEKIDKSVESKNDQLDGLTDDDYKYSTNEEVEAVVHAGQTTETPENKSDHESQRIFLAETVFEGNCASSDESIGDTTEFDNSMLSMPNVIEDPFEPSHSEDDSNSCEQIRVPVNEPDNINNDSYLGHGAKEPSSFCCKICNRKFRKQSTYEKHLRTLHKTIDSKGQWTDQTDICEIDSWQCNICSKECKSKAQLRAHKQRVHGPADHKCEYCQREFKRKHHLTDHVRMVHKGIRPYQCTFCKRSFALPRTLRIHEMLHTGERNYNCEICQKTFCLKSQLKIHLDTHAMDARFRCTICSRCQASQEELDAHMRRHSNTDGYQCTKCGRKFTKFCHMKQHEDAVHLKLRPFKCNQCEKTFAARKTLQLHERTHTRETSSTCTICDKACKGPGNLLRHMRSTHNVRTAGKTKEYGYVEVD